MSEYDHRRHLAEARKKYQDTKKIAAEAKTLVKSATPWGVFSLLSHVNIFSDWLYVLAFFAAILKDLLDIVGIGSLPAIGTVVTFCVSIFIAFMMLLANTLEKDRSMFQQMIIRRYGILIIAVLLEIAFGLNFFPWETLAVIVIYLFALAARKNAKEAEKKKKAAQAALEEEYA